MPSKAVIVGIVVAIIIIVGVAAALLMRGGGGAATTTPSSPATTASLTLKKVTLTIEYGEPWKDLVKPAIEKFREDMKKQGYDVEIKESMIPYGQDISQVITQHLAAGTAGDVLIVDSFMIPSYASAGYLYPLDDFVKNWPDWNQFPDSMKKIVSYKGHVYGVMIDTDVRMIWFRKDIFKMAGLPEDWQPKTWKDIFDAIKALKAHEDEIKKTLGIDEFYPFYIPAGTQWGEATTMQGFYMVLLGADKPPYNRLYDYEKGKWICKSTALWRAFEFYRIIYQVLKAGPTKYNFVSDVWGTHREIFSKGIVAMDLGGSWEWGEGWGPSGKAPLKACQEACKGKSGKDYEQCYVDCEWKYVGFAKMPGITGGANGEPAFVTISGGWAVVLNKNLEKDKEKLELAWKLITYIASRDNIAKFCAKYGKIAPRLDATQVPEYAQNEYLKKVTEYLKFTDFRDAIPPYPEISKLIQEITEKIVKGEIKSADEALEEYCKGLKDIVGEDNVVEYPVNKSPIYGG